jgi:ribosome biogenesis protein ERB1
MSQRLVKKLTPPTTTNGTSSGILSVQAHPKSADNLLSAVGSTLCWFDCDLSTAPYKLLSTHSANITSTCMHRQHPLFASVSDDGTVQAFHARVYEELDKTALIVPVKVMRELEGRQVKAAVFHPQQAWLYTGDSTGAVSVFV